MYKEQKINTQTENSEVSEMSIHMQNPVFIKILVFCSSWIFICIDFDFFNYLKIAFICKSKSQQDTTSQTLGQSQSKT